MREDEPSTEIASSISECIHACATLAGETWEGQYAAILDAVSWFVEAAPLIDLPNVQGPKDMIRNAAAVAARLKPAIVAWDGTAEPPPSLVSLASEVLAAVRMPDLGKRA